MLANRVPAMATPDSIASMKRAKNDDVSSELLVPVAPRPIPSYQNKGVPPESLFLTKDLLQCLEHERVSFVLHQPSCQPPGFVGAAEQILDDVGMYSLVGDPVPRSSEVADVAGAAVEEADALGVNHVEGPAGGVLGLELLPRQPLVEVTSRGGRGLVEAHGAVVVAGEGGV
ncbi:hypothetical protein MUK42_33047 [Musa troglodytarum]|uniref:Uncharacterized protein n=1 Tax=Musa troglodytarum TaxID=320322 RepID=A0A9E7L6P0_9LILI|nr:hypothetical protein MUK42_33047 [Musa troglodytarum]